VLIKANPNNFRRKARDSCNQNSADISTGGLMNHLEFIEKNVKELLIKQGFSSSVAQGGGMASD